MPKNNPVSKEEIDEIIKRHHISPDEKNIPYSTISLNKIEDVTEEDREENKGNWSDYLELHDQLVDISNHNKTNPFQSIIDYDRTKFVLCIRKTILNPAEVEPAEFRWVYPPKRGKKANYP